MKITLLQGTGRCTLHRRLTRLRHLPRRTRGTRLIRLLDRQGILTHRRSTVVDIKDISIMDLLLLRRRRPRFIIVSITTTMMVVAALPFYEAVSQPSVAVVCWKNAFSECSTSILPDQEDGAIVFRSRGNTVLFVDDNV